MTTYAANNLHKEKVLQEHLIAELVSGVGYQRRDPKAHYDRALAMDKALLLGFIQNTQPEAWEKLSQHYTASAEEVFFK